MLKTLIMKIRKYKVLCESVTLTSQVIKSPKVWDGLNFDQQRVVNEIRLVSKRMAHVSHDFELKTPFNECMNVLVKDPVVKIKSDE